MNNETTLKSLVDLWTTIATTMGIHARSIQTFKRRAESEGLPFLTITMPLLGKAVDKSLNSRFTGCEAFKLNHKNNFPVFLNEIFTVVYTRWGQPRRQKTREIKALRQLLFMFYKMKIKPTDEQISLAHDKFVATDLLVKTGDWPDTLPRVRDYISSLTDFNPWDGIGAHGNGATADKYDQVDRRSIFRDSEGPYKGLPFYHDAHACFFGKLESPDPLSMIRPTARLSCVPKDSRGPRTICMEPHEKMFSQLGLMKTWYDFVENTSPARGYVNFTDQEINQQLAEYGSFDGSYATIDLKDASDMVSWDLVKALFPPDWVDYMSACRSSSVETQHGVIDLKKFAPMGSALCFPTEATIFWAIAKTVAEDVWVYGDDIIVDNEFAIDVMAALEAYGLVVNRDKSLYTGFFRESCGGEFFHGDDITWVKCKNIDPSSVCTFANLLQEHFGLKYGEVVVKWFENTFNYRFYRKPLSCAVKPEELVYYTPKAINSVKDFPVRWDVDTQQYFIRRPKPTTANSSKHMSDIFAYNEFLRTNVKGVSYSKFFERRFDNCISKYFRVPDVLHYLDPSSGSLGVVKPSIKLTWGPLDWDVL